MTTILITTNQCIIYIILLNYSYLKKIKERIFWASRWIKNYRKKYNYFLVKKYFKYSYKKNIAFFLYFKIY